MRPSSVVPAVLVASTLAACGGGATGKASAHPNCDAYTACVADADPEGAAAAVSSYGPDSACWQNASTTSTCEDACAASLSDAHQAYPGSAACDDGTPVASASVLVSAHWKLLTSNATGPCEDETESLLNYGVYANFTTTDSSSFSAIWEGLNSEWSTIDSPCTNDAFAISCNANDYSYGAITFDGTVSDDLLTLSGTFVMGDCTYDVSGTGYN